MNRNHGTMAVVLRGMGSRVLSPSPGLDSHLKYFIEIEPRRNNSVGKYRAEGDGRTILTRSFGLRHLDGPFYPLSFVFPNSQSVGYRLYRYYSVTF